MVTIKHNFNSLEPWLEHHRSLFNEKELSDLYCVIEICQKCYAKHKFYPTDVDLFTHAFNCATIVADLNLQAEAIIATILLAIPQYLPDWRKELVFLDNKVIELLDGITKVNKIRKLGTLADVESGANKKSQIETVRQMLLAMTSDIRVVLITLVERSELMLHLSSCKDPEMRRKIALETSEIFSPLANRLGISQIKWELEDLSFKYLYPKEYKKIATLLDETREERLNYIEKIKKYFSSEIEQMGIKNFQISGRAKHIYSIWKKMYKKDYDFSHLYDIRAVRVLVPDIKDCYTVLGVVHTAYSPIPGEFDDYISNPKPNNYKSLHTCVVGPENKVIEVQIRTFAMHDYAEYGVAAHWRYKEFGESVDNNSELLVKKVAWLRQVLDWRKDLNSRSDIAEIFKNEIFNDTVYVMTPGGRIIALPNGSTPIDFAYAVHSQIGHRCRGAKIDGVMVPLSTVLQNGQKVEILTAKEGGPSINWLHDGLLKSNKAIKHVRRYIRFQHYEDYFNLGSEIFERELSKFPASMRPPLKDILSKLSYNNEKSMCIDLGRGYLSVIALKKAINNLIKKANTHVENIDFNIEHNSSLQKLSGNYPISNNNYRNNQVEGVLVNGVSGVMTYLAKCCKPLLGDLIVGFVTRGKGIAIHRSDCYSMKNMSSENSTKCIPVSWGNSAIYNSSFSIDLKIVVNEQTPKLIKEITEVFAIEKVSVIRFKTINKNDRDIIYFTLQITGEDFDITSMINKIINIDGIIEASRS